MRIASHKGLTLVEMLIVIAILGILTTIAITSYPLFIKSESVEKETHAVVAIFAEARSQTISSQNASQYGVHVASTSVTLFTGSSYNSGNAANRTFTLSPRNFITNLALTGSANDVVFNRLSGDTSNDGSFKIVSTTTNSLARTVTIYRTGLVESN